MKKLVLLSLMLSIFHSEATIWYVAKNGDDSSGNGTEALPWLTVQNGCNEASAGDTIKVGAGYYDEVITVTVSGSAGSPIILDGQGVATIKQFVTGQPYWNLVNMQVSGVLTSFSRLIWLRRNADFTIISNCVLNAAQQRNVVGIKWENPTTLPFGTDTADQCLVVSNRITGIRGTDVIEVMGTSNIITGNILHDVTMADFITIFGETNRFIGNICSNNFQQTGLGNHPDFVQTFGNNGFGSRYHVISQNRVYNIIDGGVAQLEGNLLEEISDWTISNNLFVNIQNPVSCSMPGVRIIGNVFYRCTNGDEPGGPIDGGHPITPGGRAYSGAPTYPGQPVPGTNFAHRTRILGNAFIDCGDERLSRGWYSFSSTDRLTNCIADYNYVGKLGFNGVTLNANPASAINGSFDASYDAGKFYETHGVVGNGVNPFWNLHSSPSHPYTPALDENFYYPTPPTINDLRLRIGSALVNAGTNVTGFTTDYEGTARDGTNDIGMLEQVIDFTAKYVSTSGSDVAAGTLAAPWRTVTKAAATLVGGEKVIILPGTYNEQVQESTSGSAGNLITYQSEIPHYAIIESFRISGAYVKIDGLKLVGYAGNSNTWAAATRIDTAANNYIITNCWYSDTPFAIGTNFSFSASGGNQIINDEIDWLNTGFLAGDKVYLGSSGLDGLWYTNHDTVWLVSDIDADRMWVTNAAGDSFAADGGVNYWAFIRPGTSSPGFYAIDHIISGGVGPTNGLISGNTISNWVGQAINMTGIGHTVEKNFLTKLHSFRFIGFSGNNHIIRQNIIKDSPNVLHYSTADLDSITHPEGTGWYDYAVGMIAGNVGSVVTNKNILVQSNWFENLENQLGRVDDEETETWNIRYENNVFVGVSEHFSGGRDGMSWTSNLFYRCSMKVHPLSIGGRAPPQTNYIVTHNVFLDCGSYESLNDSGWYSISDNAITFTTNYNYISQPEVTGYASKDDFTEANGINGGNPVFRHLIDLDGHDNTPFTHDDGIKVLPHSPLSSAGIGAVGTYAIIPNWPVAHFALSSPLGWHEPIEELYNPDWFDALPTTRTNLQRPWFTAPGLPEPPIEISFNATLSMSGIQNATTNTLITAYLWNFGDGATHLTNSPLVSHTYTESGPVWVTLTVTNSMGTWNTYSNNYTLLGSYEEPPPTPNALRVIIRGGNRFNGNVILR